MAREIAVRKFIDENSLGLKMVKNSVELLTMVPYIKIKKG